jgi:hypothetical protein
MMAGKFISIPQFFIITSWQKLLSKEEMQETVPASLYI